MSSTSCSNPRSESAVFLEIRSRPRAHSSSFVSAVLTDQLISCGVITPQRARQTPVKTAAGR